MAERTVKIGEMAYLDPDKRWRRASHGETVKVHTDGLERFDKFNTLPGVGEESDQESGDESDRESETKPRPARTRKPAESKD